MAASATLVLAGSTFATVTPTTVFGDSYIIKDGVGASARFYSVLDVYIKCGNANDIISSTFGVSAYVSSYTQNQGKAFVQTNGTAASSWLPTNDDGKGWDSYVTCGARVQGSDSTLAGGKAGFLGLQLDTNWAAASNGSQIVGQAGGAGWYPSIGASTSSNPYCRGGYNGGTSATAGYWNTAKATTNIAGNGIAVGQSLSNYWMIGRFVVDVTPSDPSTPLPGPLTMTMKFAIAGKQNGSTTFTGSTNAAGRFDYTLNFATDYCLWPACPSDLDGNHAVDTADLSMVLLNFGACTGCASDRDGNGFVDMADLALELLEFGSCEPCPCSGPWACR